MEIGNLYGFILTLVLIGMVLGVGVLVLDKFMAVSGLTTNAKTAINNTINAITPIGSTWLGIIVTVVVVGMLLYIVVKSFGRGR